MNKQETVRFFSAVHSLYPREDAFLQADRLMVETWTALLGDIPYRVCCLALQKHALQSRFVPTVAELRENAEALLHPETELTGREMWALVMKAVRRSTLHYREEYAALPEAAQKLVGSPAQLREWAVSEHFNEPSACASFVRGYEQLRRRDRENALLPASLRAEAALLGKGQGQQATGS